MKNILTVDLEDWYHICGIPNAPPQEEWPLLKSRVVENAERLLQLLAEHKTKATFFALGYIAEHNKGLIERICEEGHEIASHGYSHEVLMGISPTEFREDLLRSREVIKSITGVYPRGFRAPSFSITPQTKWALDILSEAGFEYDSSIFPAKREEGGFIGMSCIPHDITVSNGRKIKEFPITIASFMGLKIPFSGGGYLRFLPYQALRYFFSLANKKNQPVIAYIHPRDIDPGQPRLAMPFIKGLKTYSGLASCEAKFRRLLQEFEFGPIKEFL